MRTAVVRAVAVAALVLGASLAPSPALAKCKKECKTLIVNGFRACKKACPKKKPGRTCRATCSTQFNSDKATCRSATNPTPPSCGATTTTTTTASTSTITFSTTSTTMQLLGLPVLNGNVPPGFAEAGFIQAATLDNPTDPTSGGTLTLNGTTMIVPANSVVQFPANTLTWAALFDQMVSNPVYDPGLPQPNPSNLAIPQGKTGLALADNPAQQLGMSPYLPFNAVVVGNIDVINATGHGAGAYIIGLILPIGQDVGNAGQGFMTFIDYAKGRFEVGGTFGVQNTGTVIEINDPTGRYGWAHSPDPRWSVDADNPTITSGNGFPMGLPKVAPPAIDPDRPLFNRPVNPPIGDPNNDPFVQAGAPLQVIVMPPSSAPGTTQPDPWTQVPLMLGDYVAYSGVLYKNDPNVPIDPAIPWNRQTYISANTVSPDKLAVYTAACPDTSGACTGAVGPAYLQIGQLVIGTGGTPINVPANAALGIGGGTIPLPEPKGNIVFNGFVTDSTQLVDVFAVDIDPSTGAESHRLLGTALPEPGPAGGKGNKGRFRFEVGKGNFLPVTRVYTAISRHGTIQVPNQIGNIVPPQGGIVSGQYHSPVLTLAFPDAPPGFPNIPNNFDTIPFLINGEGGNLAAGPLSPLPPSAP